MSRTCCSVAFVGNSATRRVPEVKSSPRLSPLTPTASAPTSKITPENEKNHFEAPMKSQRNRCRLECAPSIAGLETAFERASVPSTACVNRTAVRNETSVPTPSVKAKPFTPAVASMKRMNATMNVTTLASIIAESPLR